MLLLLLSGACNQALPVHSKSVLVGAPQSQRVNGRYLTPTIRPLVVQHTANCRLSLYGHLDGKCIYLPDVVKVIGLLKVCDGSLLHPA
jgi:hypothetical protein